MKPEPLKGKIMKEYVEGMKTEVGKIYFDNPIVRVSDVASAVDWLRDKIIDVDLTQQAEDIQTTIDCLIIEAFPDIITGKNKTKED